MVAGEALRVLNKSVFPWKQIAEIQNEDRVPFAAISPNVEFIAHSNALTILIRRLPTGDRVGEIPLKRSGQMAFHPTEKWLAAGGDILSLIRVDGDHRVERLLVGGTLLSSLETSGGLKNRVASVSVETGVSFRAAQTSDLAFTSGKNYPAYQAARHAG